MFEKSSIHKGVDAEIAGTLQRASVASDPRSVALLAITIHSDDKGPAVTAWPALCCWAQPTTAAGSSDFSRAGSYCQPLRWNCSIAGARVMLC